VPVKGHEVRSLLESRPLGLLGDDDAALVADHLKTCDPCTRQADALDGVYAELAALVDRDEAELPWSDDLRSRILTAAAEAPEEELTVEATSTAA
jgi:hypothetical protein